MSKLSETNEECVFSGVNLALNISVCFNFLPPVVFQPPDDQTLVTVLVFFFCFFCDSSPSKIQSHDHPFKGLPVITQVDWVENSLTEH